jgi:hypothetical protein
MTTLRQAAQQALEALRAFQYRSEGCVQPDFVDDAITTLRQALEVEQQLDKPMAEIWWDDSKDCDWQLKMLVEPAVARGVRIPLYAGDYEAMPVMYVNQDGSFTVKAPNEELE